MAEVAVTSVAPTRLSLPNKIRHDILGVVEATALVDTGSEVNLVRQSLLPADWFVSAVNPINFRAANQVMMTGGQLEVECILDFEGADLGTGSLRMMSLPIICYNAE